MWSPSWYFFSLHPVGIYHLAACPHCCLSPLHCTPLGNVWLRHVEDWVAIRPPLRLPFFRMTRCSSWPCMPDAPAPSLSWWPSAGLTLVWHQGAQNRTQFSRWGLTSAKERGRFTSLDLRVGCLPKQPRLQAATFSAARLASGSPSTYCPAHLFLQKCYPAAFSIGRWTDNCMYIYM